MQWVQEEIIRLRHFHHLAHVHHGHAIADVLHHAQVVGDEQIGQVELRLQILQQVERLRLDRHVQRRHRLVAHDKLRVEGQGAGNADALALAAAEGVRIAHHVLGTQPHHLEQLSHAILQLLALGDAVDDQRLAHDLQQRPARIQRSVGILKDHLHVAAQTLEARSSAACATLMTPMLAIFEPDVAAGRVVGAQDATARGRLAAAAFADQAQRLALADEEVDPIHSLDVADEPSPDALLRIGNYLLADSRTSSNLSPMSMVFASVDGWCVGG